MISSASPLPILRYLVRAHTSLRETMAIIEQSTVKIAVVTNDAGKLLRTVTDGDIRRGLLKGLDLQSPVRDLPGREPVTCSDQASREAIALLLDQLDVSAVVMVSADEVPVGILDRTSSSGMTFMSPPHLGSRELELVQAAFEDNWIAPAGPNLTKFEQSLADVSERRHALALSSGTAALHLALCALRIAPGDRVYVSDLTFAASLQPILYERATPVLIDCEPNSWNMSPTALERKLAQDAERGALPRAIILVHLYGQPAELAAICRIADNYGIPIVEDAAESLGATYANRPSGSHGVLAAFSFNGNKIITTSGGGALVGDDNELIAFARYLSTQGREPLEHYQHAEVAYNYRMSNVLAGIGVGQLEVLGERVERRREIHRHYREKLRDIPGMGFQENPEGGNGNRWLTVVTLDPNFIDRHPYQIMRELRESGIETRPGWKPMHMQPVCAGAEFEPHDRIAPVSSRLFFQSLCLPSGSSLQTGEQDRIIGLLRKTVRKA
jgi:dTDP-4-amino-4,6-dideoxygalactose transaminase